MSKKINSLTLVLLLVSVVAQISLADTVNIDPHKIILNDSTKNDTIQASIPMQISSTISNFNATISFNGKGEIKATSYKYCNVDDMLHIYFDKEEVVKFLSDNNISGQVTASVSGSLMDGDKSVTFSGDDKIEVVEPKEDTRYRKN